MKYSKKMPRLSSGHRKIRLLFFVVCLNCGSDFVVVVEEVDAQCAGDKDAGDQSRGLNTLAGSGTGTVSALTQQ